MPEAEYATTSPLPIDAIWDFVRDMDGWAPFVTGYLSHEKQGERDSLWVLRGDVGVLSRAVTFRVHVTEWAGPSRVAFALEGVNEPLKGEGAFHMERVGGAGATPSGVAAPRRGAFARGLEAIVRWLLRAFRAPAPRAAPAEGGGAAATRLAFRLRIDPGGPMAPMLAALIAPALRPAAEDLAEKILSHLEARHGLR
jgi:carbon monoxide dehydrogenase subunit G